MPTPRMTVDRHGRPTESVTCPSCGPVEIPYDCVTWTRAGLVPTSGYCPKCRTRVVWADALGRRHDPVLAKPPDGSEQIGLVTSE